MNLKFKDGYYCDVRCEKRYVSNVQYTGNNLTECKETVIDKAFIRIYDGKLWYYCSTDSRDDIQAEMDRLYACAGKPDADIENNVTVKKFEINKAEHILYAKEKVSDVPLDKKRDFIEKRKKYAETDEYLKLATVSYNDRYSLYEFVSSLGADIVYDVQYASLRLNLSLAYGRESFDDTLVYVIVTSPVAESTVLTAIPPFSFMVFLSAVVRLLTLTAITFSVTFPKVSVRRTGISTQRSFVEETAVSFIPLKLATSPETVIPAAVFCSAVKRSNQDAGA